MFIDRYIQAEILNTLEPGKVVVITGPRRTGKTELLKKVTASLTEKQLWLNGDDIVMQELFSPISIENYKLNFGSIELLIIDEAQKIPEIGKKLKLLVDNLSHIKVIATGSSAFDLANQFGEPLTGRKKEFNLYPFAQLEYRKYENIAETYGRLNHRLVYGNYPELIHLATKTEKEKYLRNLTNAYLFKDILDFEGIKNADKLRDLLRLVAFQIGNEVSLNELANSLSLHKDTVARYLDLLSKVFVLFKVGGFSRNLRKEVTKMNRWYFYDNGVRNTLINNMNDFELRNDQGALWENFLISERIKYQQYKNIFAANYFWRTYDQQEIDWIEEYKGHLHAYEMKLNTTKKFKVPSAWKKVYPEATFKIIHPKNFLEWIE